MTPVTLHISREGATIGQFPLDTAQQCLDSGTILPSDLCWHEGMSEWKPVSEVVLGTIAPPPPPSDYVPPPLQGTLPAGTYTTTGVDTVPGAAAPSQKTRSGWKNFAIAGVVLLSCCICGVMGSIFYFFSDVEESLPPINLGTPQGETPQLLANQKAIDLVKATFTTNLRPDIPYKTGPLRDGTAVLVGDSGAYWVKDGTVYAANGSALTWSSGLPGTPIYEQLGVTPSGTPFGKRIGMSEVESAIR